MKKTVSLHVGGGQAHRTHNGRFYKGRGPDHVEQARRGENETLVDMSHREAYEEIFGAAVSAYNEKQKRADRQISSYFDTVRHDATRHAVYEMVLQVGDRNTTGVEDCDTERAILREYIQTFEARNPQMKVVGAYIHADEATLHAHLDFIPWADGYKRGPERQCSISKCCEQMGYAKGARINETSQAAWTSAEREVLEAITRAHGIEVDYVRDGRLHEADKEIFIQESKAREASKKVSELHSEEMGLLLETYKLRAEARGQGYEYLPSTEVEALRAEAAKGAEAIIEAAALKETLENVSDILNSDDELAEKWAEALDRWNQLAEMVDEADFEDDFEL